MSIHPVIKTAISAIMLAHAASALADNPPANNGPVIIQQGYVAGPNNTPNPAERNNRPMGDEDEDDVYHDPVQYDYDSMGEMDHEMEEDMGGKAAGAEGSRGSAGGGGRR